MSKVTVDDVRAMAQLSNISLGDDEASSLQEDIEHILSYVDMLAGLDTTGIEPTYQLNNLKNVFREDVENQGGETREALLSLAPESLDNQVKVPKVL